jgi:hypothetical protein
LLIWLASHVKRGGRVKINDGSWYRSIGESTFTLNEV